MLTSRGKNRLRGNCDQVKFIRKRFSADGYISSVETKFNRGQQKL